MPAQQRLEADDGFIVGIDHRLVVEHEFVVLQRAAQREFQLAALFSVGMERGLIAEVQPTALFLGPVERQVGIAHQRFHRRPVARADRGADAGADVKRVVVHLIGARKHLDHRLGNPRHAGMIGCVANHDGKLVAAQTADQLVVADDRLEAVGHARQQLVADQVAQRIVDRLEPVEVDHQEGAAGAPLLGIAHRLAQRLGYHHAVGQAGERVIARHVSDLLARFALLGNV